MPKTQSTVTKQTKGGGAVAKDTKASKKAKKVNDTSQTEPIATCSNEPTAYEKLITKLNAKRKGEIAGDKRVKTPVKKARMATASVQVEVDKETTPESIHADFIEDGQIMDMSVTVDKQRREFPSPSDDKDMETNDESREGLKNNNVTVSRPLGATGSTADVVQLPDRGEWSSTSLIKTNDGLTQMLEIMQKFMLKKGIIEKPMNAQELRDFLQEEENMEVDERQTPVMEKLK